MPYIVYDQTGAQSSVGDQPASGSATPVASGPSGSRSVIEIGAWSNSSAGANAAFTYQRTSANDSSSTATRIEQAQIRLPYAFTVTGWALTQYQASGTQTFYLCKNRTGSSVNYGSIVTVTAGNATTSAFPGNAFSNTFTKGAYNYAVGDTIGAVGMNGTAGPSDAHLWLTIEWL